nr:hypothetical protein B0A51_11508 [Rachicladosporium sp. CCFEE 5018]
MAKDTATAEKTYSSDLFVALLAVFQKKAGTLCNADYEFMAAAVGSTATALQHKFREPKKKAAELLTKEGNGETATPKSGKKRGEKVQAAADGEEDDEASPTPAKKQKKYVRNKKGDPVKQEKTSDDEGGEAGEEGEEGGEFVAHSHFDDAVGDA